MAKQIACIILNRLPCEVVEATWVADSGAAKGKIRPLAVTLATAQSGESQSRVVDSLSPLSPEARVDENAQAQRATPWSSELWRSAVANVSEKRPNKNVILSVNHAAAQLGVKSGQRVVEACAKVPQLQLVSVTEGALKEALARVAECVTAFGVTVSLELPDTVWVDISGVSHLYGGSNELLQEMRDTLSELGHHVRIVASRGARLSQALGRWGNAVRQNGVLEVPDTALESELNALSIQALPVESEVRTWLAQMGVLFLGELTRIPFELTSSRLGRFARTALDTLRGYDEEPLVPFTSAKTMSEQVLWDHPLEGIEPMRFALRRICDRLSKRLKGRRLATHLLRFEVFLERSGEPTAQPQQHETARTAASEHPSEQQLTLKDSSKRPTLKGECELASALYREEELTRVLTARVAQLKLTAGALGLRVELARLVPSVLRQLRLDFAGNGVGYDRVANWDVMVAELEADIGVERVGVLNVVDCHLPENGSSLVPVREMSKQTLKPKRRAARRSRQQHSELRQPQAGSVGGRSKQNSDLPQLGLSSSHSANQSEVRSLAKPGEERGSVVRAVSASTEPEPPVNETPSVSQWVPTRIFDPPIPIYGAIRAGEMVALGRIAYTVKWCQFERRIESVEWWSNRKISRDYLRVWLTSGGENCVAIVCVDRLKRERTLFALCD